MAVSFKTLWTRHPSNMGVRSPCTTDGKVNFENQCAIRMGECFLKSGVPLGSFSGAKCYPGHKHNQSHILRAEELADWMKAQPVLFGKVDIKRNVKASNYAGKNGVIFLKNFWGVGNQGDHIDLWNGSKMTLGLPEYFTVAQEVWFWEVS
jgi:hypothetical protein